jgi:pyridoxine kinase
MKRCLTIQDYSCMGRCSLTVALPILSATGVETIGLPTAILSNHTAFKDWSYHDLSDEMIHNVDMWMDYNHHFDCIYTGYLGNGQAKIVDDIIRKLKCDDTMIVVDPAFGDNGKLYSGFDANHVTEIKGLLKYADVICPNMTEACALLDIPYKGEGLSEIEAQRLTLSLSKYGPRKIVVTGVLTDDGRAGCVMFDKNEENLSYYFTENLPGRYHGAGDTFASALTGALMNGVSMKNAVKIAHDFVHKGMIDASKEGLDGLLYGLPFERHLNYLYNCIQRRKKD